MTLDKAVLARDHSQRVFSQSFEEFSGRMVPPRLARGANMLKQYGSVLVAHRTGYGVPGEVLVAIWGLETDFGVNIGKFPTLRSMATLADDCRRTEMFQAELIDALRIVERGDLGRRKCAAPGPAKSARPSSCRRPTSNSPSTSTATAAATCCAACRTYWPRPRIICGYGWQRGKDWQPGGANFAVIQQWNKSEVYARTIAYFATQLSRAP